ncbi:hypothetical protein LR48_Vigan08g100200 [Vigna angularis]|uniref:Uncharacterized protein n=1 Tax=Phaseolus angularis TaxID=3914 RepID=A0A0L9V505_PHAAN|nr:hypothetical protein LR48_Vigan08g100200 [Vigna angularis]
MKRKERHIAQLATAEEEQHVTEENVNSGSVSMTEAVTTVVDKEWTISDEMRRLEENISMAEADAEGAAEEEEKRRRKVRDVENSAEFYRIMQKAECAQLSARSYTSSYASVSVWAYTSSYTFPSSRPSLVFDKLLGLVCYRLFGPVLDGEKLFGLQSSQENSKEKCLVDGIGILKYECGYRAKLAFMLIFCDYSFSSREE